MELNFLQKLVIYLKENLCKKEEMSMIRKILAWFINLEKEPTKENVLKYALKNYLNKTNGSNGLCHYLNDSFEHYLNKHVGCYANIKCYIPLYDKNYAIKYFKGRDSIYWWNIEDWWHRYRFMKWLIKQYKE